MTVKGRDCVRSKLVSEGTNNISELDPSSSHSRLTDNDFPPNAYSYYIYVEMQRTCFYSARLSMDASSYRMSEVLAVLHVYISTILILKRVHIL